MDTQLRRGLLDVCVLGVLRKGDSYGYKIIKDLDGIVDISESTLYPILKRLESSGLVTSYTAEHNFRLRKYYSISSAGYGRIEDFCRDYAELRKAVAFIENGRLGAGGADNLADNADINKNRGAASDEENNHRREN